MQQQEFKVHKISSELEYEEQRRIDAEQIVRDIDSLNDMAILSSSLLSRSNEVPLSSNCNSL